MFRFDEFSKLCQKRLYTPSSLRQLDAARQVIENQKLRWKTPQPNHDDASRTNLLEKIVLREKNVNY